MQIVLITGGLGNQMFTYAFYFVLAKRRKFEYVEIDFFQTDKHHSGYELDKIFPAITTRSIHYYKLINKIYSNNLIRKIYKRKIQPGVKYVSDIMLTPYPFVIYEGFWQSEMYFESFKNDIRCLYKFNYNLLNAKTKDALEKVKKINSISIHIRRGDYTEHEEFNNICTIDYYREAIELIKKTVNEPLYYIFSDDKDWVKDNITEFEYTLVDWNKGSESWQDMFLMSKCKHNIIANSTFSWWAAWLNENETKVIISPKKWFNNLPENDIVPSEWIRI
ncbi:alpha-1,2-fucosyltransferase [Spirosoma harenae]